MRTVFLSVVAFAMAIVLEPQAARPETIKEALAAAYIANPQIKAQRARLRATDEEVSRAKSGYRPRVQGEAVHTYQETSTSDGGGGFPGGSFGGGDGESWPRSYSLSLSQPLFRGFRTMNSVSAARANVEAAREDLRNTAQQVLLDAATQYMNVLRDQSIVRLRQNNVEFLSEQLQATRDRFEVGEVTRTDVAQSAPRAAGAISELNLAKANLQTAAPLTSGSSVIRPSPQDSDSQWIRLLPNRLMPPSRRAKRGTRRSSPGFSGSRPRNMTPSA